MPRRGERWPFAASVEGLFQQVLLLQRKGLDFAICREYVFHPTRKWRFDIALVNSPKIVIGLEYQGGIFGFGGHQRVRGMRNDWAKFDEAQVLGWMVLLFGPDETRSGEAMNVIERAVQSRLESVERRQ